MTTDELELLARADPAPASSGPWSDRPLDGRARQDLVLLREHGPLQALVRRRWLLGAAAAAAGVLALSAVWLVRPVDPAYAATPPPAEFSAIGADPATLLGDLAADAADDPAGAAAAATGWEEWSLSTQVAGADVTSAVVPQEVARTVAADGDATLRTVAGTPSFPSEEYERAWRRDGEPVAAGEDLGTLVVPADQALFPDPPPTTADAMRDYLARAHPLDEGGTSQLFVAVSDLAREWTLDAPQRAALLEVLAAAPDVEVVGEGTDRAGRPGVALATESDRTGLPTRYLLVLDPASGAVLASEQQLTTDPGALDVPVPSTIAYTLFGARTGDG